MNRNHTWNVLVNPDRVDHPIDRRYARLSGVHDRFDTYLFTAAVIWAAISAGILSLLVPAVVAAPIMAIITIAAVHAARVKYRAKLGEARAAARELDDTIGPIEITRSSILDPVLRSHADRAVTAQSRIIGSVAFQHGSLGDQEPIARNVAVTTWRAVSTAAALDKTLIARANLSATLNDRQIPLEAVELESRNAELSITARQTSIDTATSELVTLAEKVTELDSRLLTPAAREHLRSLVDTPPTTASGGDELAARISAAHQVLDAGGSTPQSLPLRQQ